VCGRYALVGPISRHRKSRPIDELLEWYPGLVDAIDARPMRFNVAPTDVMPIVGLNREGGPSIRELRWGLVPYWAKDAKIGYKAINARAEAVDEKPMFREAFKRRVAAWCQPAAISSGSPRALQSNRISSTTRTANC
jgi:putative SOS response-associated peptidase YedK